MNGKSKQEIENEISQVMTKFLKEQMGEKADERIEIFTLNKDLGKVYQV